MKNIINFTVFFAFVIVVFGSCQKDSACENCRDTNQAPIAKAGLSQVITLPTDSVTLNGTASKDPDGSISSFLWRKIGSPASFTLTNPDSSITKIKNLTQGTFSFELKVTDNHGFIAKDTVHIIINAASNSCAANRPIINAQLVPIGILSEPRQDVYTATAGNKILFAGGLGGQSGYDVSSRVDIYDFATNTWSKAELSIARHAMTVATIGNKIFFAGGSYYFPDGGWADFSRVDIYDAITNIWTTAELSEARSFLSSAIQGDKVFFAGGYIGDNGDKFSNHVDIYNTTTNTWSSASLSERRDGLSATTVGNKIYFTGGGNKNEVLTKIDIYNGADNSWSISNLNEGRIFLSSIAVANKIYWAGGINSIEYGGGETSQVEIRDINTEVSTFNCLAQEKSSFGTVLKGNEIVFFMGAPSAQPQNFDIYNTATDIWSVATLNQGLNYPGIISVNNKIYVAGGDRSSGGGITNQVWLLEW